MKDRSNAVKLALMAILFLTFPLALTACDLSFLFGDAGTSLPDGAGASITIGSAEASPGGTARVRISITVSSSSGLTEFQVGPNGALVFDPQVIQLREISGVGDFTVLASNIDNDKGEARFAAANIQGSLSQGAILEIEVDAVGRSGESTELRLTGVDVLRGASGNQIAPVTITSGEIAIK